jgi:hypothetical protein
MTKKELENKHISNRIGIDPSNYPAHTRTSIEYAISMLEELIPKEPPFVVSDGEILRKIKELKSLIK